MSYSDDDGVVWYTRCICGDQHSSEVKCKKCRDSPLIGCDTCGKWLHMDCLGVEDDDLPDEFEFVCDFCNPARTYSRFIRPDYKARAARDPSPSPSPSPPPVPHYPTANTFHGYHAAHHGPASGGGKAKGGMGKGGKPKAKPKKSRAGGKRERKIVVHTKRKKRSKPSRNAAEVARRNALAQAQAQAQVQHASHFQGLYPGMGMYQMYNAYNPYMNPYGYGYPNQTTQYYNPYAPQGLGGVHHQMPGLVQPLPQLPEEYSDEYYEYEVEYEYSDDYDELEDSWIPGTLAIDCKAHNELLPILPRNDVYNLDGLHSELILYLLSFLSTRDTLALARVSSHLRFTILTPLAWKTADFSFAAATLPPEFFVGLAPCLAGSVSLSFAGCAGFNDAAAAALGHSLDGHGLSVLNLTGCVNLTGVGLFALASHVADLRVLNLTGAHSLLDIERANACAPDKGSLSHSALVAYTHKALIQMVSTSPDLSSLILDYARVPEDTVKYFLALATTSSNPLLSSIALFSVHGVASLSPRTASRVRAVFEKSPRLLPPGISLIDVPPSLDLDLVASSLEDAKAAVLAHPSIGSLHAILGSLLEASGDLPGARAAYAVAASSSSFFPGTLGLPHVALARLSSASAPTTSIAFSIAALALIPFNTPPTPDLADSALETLLSLSPFPSVSSDAKALDQPSLATLVRSSLTSLTSSHLTRLLSHFS